MTDPSPPGEDLARTARRALVVLSLVALFFLVW